MALNYRKIHELTETIGTYTYALSNIKKLCIQLSEKKSPIHIDIKVVGIRQKDKSISDFEKKSPVVVIGDMGQFGRGNVGQPYYINFPDGVPSHVDSKSYEQPGFEEKELPNEVALIMFGSVATYYKEKLQNAESELNKYLISVKDLIKE